MISSLFWTFLKLGCTAFGGPMAHLALFRQELVVRKQWVDEEEYSQLVALCQVIPGPASSQVGMALGYRRGGFWGALAAFVGFTLPSAVLMALAGWAWVAGLGFETDTLVLALKCVAFVVVTDAALGMWRALCRTPITRGVAVLTMMLFVSINHPLAPLTVMAIAFGLALWQSREAHATDVSSPIVGVPRLLGWITVIGVIGGIFWLLAETTGAPLGALAWALYQSGALVFGGGHVVLPLLDATVSPPLSPETFLAGYGLAQAMPGPLFTIATFIGSVYPGVNPLLGAVLATLCIFLPGALFLTATLPTAMAAMQTVQAHVHYVNASVVGLVFAVLIDPISRTAVVDSTTMILSGIGLLLTLGFRQSPLRVVLVMVTVAYGITAITA